MGLTCYKWKADTIKLKGMGKVDDPDEGVGEAEDPTEADDPDEGVGEVDDLDEGVGEADDPDKRVGEADNPNVALLGLHICIYKEISCAPRLVLIKKDSYKERIPKNMLIRIPIRKITLHQGREVNPHNPR